jgi:hypothetical protein
MSSRISTSVFTIFLGITLTLTTTVCQAQAALFILIFGDKVATENFHLSLDAGVNASTLPGIEQGNPVYGINFGLGSFIRMNDKWTLRPEFKPLSPKGAKDVKNILPNEVTLNDPKTDFVLNYIDVPLLLQYKISNSFFVAGGPQISFLTTSDQKTSGTTISGQQVEIKQDLRPHMNRQDFSVPLEIGYSLSKKRGGKGLDLKLRYNIGITEVFTNSTLGSSTNNTFQFILSFPFINLPEEGN